MEIKQIEGTRYSVDTEGNVYGVKKRILRGRDNGHGYLQVLLAVEPYHYVPFLIHSLVAEAFMGPKPEGTDIDHINFKRDDNRLENLRYLASSINRARRQKRGTKQPPSA